MNANMPLNNNVFGAIIIFQQMHYTFTKFLYNQCVSFTYITILKVENTT